MNVSLTSELDQFVATKVASGRYTSASEVVREALRLMEERDQQRSVELAAFQQEIGSRLASLARGEHVDPASVREHFQKKSQERMKRGA